MTQHTLIAIFLLSLITLSLSQCLTDNDSIQPFNKDARSKLYLGEQTFTLNMLKALQSTSPSENIFFSPYSTFHALLLTYFGAKGTTETELKNVLNLNWTNSKFDVMQAYRLEESLRQRRAANSSVIFRTADKVFVAKEAGFKECMKDLFHEEFESLDFQKDAENSRVYINKFVENVTDNNIKDILIPGTITQATDLVVANAAYFKGQWASKFNADETFKGIFYSTPEKYNFVDMMYKKGVFNHAVNERLGCHVLELPYLGEDNGISMMIFLPPFVPNGLENVLTRLTPQALEEALDEGVSREVELQLPRFSFEKTYQMVPVLSDMGIKNLFDSTANLTGFSDKANLHLDDAVHKAKIEVNEEGSTAAAATVLFTFRSSRPLDPAQFFCDHPFMFLIYDQKSRAILFAGVYRGPEQ
ncbi:serine protease inhibitor 88Ea-like [Bradysia coprophila]|uniref:serine protease inhibitor 88Ea-like n=1 Tax=Bradysia coprophila TaxID=38358 RepID=UPI00187DD2E6|nr:serine protease inhibitor 88Ea-like [Bradysia coprophila]XP_037038157.1 serine protease inhibitor 88Ea-like [Bradysia coprophila]XP_037038158.1 serine protease inhibitor 88Ea-like [Bradysia coprophila]